MIEQFTNSIKKAFFEALEKLGYVDGTVVSSQNDIILEVPKDKDHGDYSVNVAMRLARVARKRPLDIANELVSLINKEETHLSNIEIAGPGFINLTIDLTYLTKVVNKVIDEEEKYDGYVNVCAHHLDSLIFIDERREEHLKEIFVTCSRYEADFWEMAYELKG